MLGQRHLRWQGPALTAPYDDEARMQAVIAKVALQSRYPHPVLHVLATYQSAGTEPMCSPRRRRKRGPSVMFAEARYADSAAPARPAEQGFVRHRAGGDAGLLHLAVLEGVILGFAHVVRRWRPWHGQRDDLALGVGVRESVDVLMGLDLTTPRGLSNLCKCPLLADSSLSRIAPAYSAWAADCPPGAFDVRRGRLHGRRAGEINAICDDAR